MTRRSAGVPVDVAVLGGGPAGATAALLLARWGHSVTLLTRPAPRPALAESLPPSCVRLFDRLGVRQVIDAAGFVRSTGNTVHWGGGAPRVEPFGGELTGYQVVRDHFDRVLLREAESAGAVVARGAIVRDVALGEGDQSRVSYERAGRTHLLDARWVLDCTGRVGLLARRGWRKNEPGTRTMAIVAAWERASGWPVADPTHTIVESYEGGWGWSVPTSPTRRLVTLMVDPMRTRLGRGAALAATYAEELSRLRVLSGLVADATRSGRVWARDASSYSAARSAAPGALLVGDAASFIDPLSSFGVKKALASAWLSAVVARTALTDEKMLPHALDLHERRERGIYDALRRRLSALAQDAAAGHAEGFWEQRGMEAALDPLDEPDVAALRTDPEVLGAFAALRARDRISLTVTSLVERGRKAVVQGDLVILEEQLRFAAFPAGVRYLRNVDLIRLMELAPRHQQVPDLLDAYARASPGATMPDLLGALSVLIGKGALALE